MALPLCNNCNYAIASKISFFLKIKNQISEFSEFTTNPIKLDQFEKIEQNFFLH